MGSCLARFCPPLAGPTTTGRRLCMLVTFYVPFSVSGNLGNNPPDICSIGNVLVTFELRNLQGIRRVLPEERRYD